jgi:NAD(P)H-hydrate epimerase
MAHRSGSLPPTLTTAQMRQVDRLMVEAYGISLPQMMENAGRHLAELARRMLGGDVSRKRISVLAGTGNNGGGGMVAERHLHNCWAWVQVKLVPGSARLKGVPAQQRLTVRTMGLEAKTAPPLDQADLVIDALIGYGLSGQTRPETADWIERVNAARRPTLSLDVPSGLDATSGAPNQPTVRATATLTLALPKTGLLAPAARPFLGQLYLADIGVPPELYLQLGLTVPPVFALDAIVAVPLEPPAPQPAKGIGVVPRL